MSQKSDAIFLIAGDGDLEKIPRAAYDREDLLQELLDRYPELLAGEQIRSGGPVRWLVVEREAGIPDSEGASARWAVDHLLLDQKGRPTFVEVKRSSDSRIRREVLGQMLEYAANARSFWPIERLRSKAATRQGGEEALEEAVRQLLADSSDADPSDQVEQFWSRVDENLRNGDVRLLFVADELRTELRRVIEFLNEQMPRVEVLGVEVPQYVGENLRVLVPRLVGQTEYALQEKRASQPRSLTNRKEFLESCPPAARRFFERLLAEARDRGLVIQWGTKGMSIRFPQSDGSPCTLFYGFPPPDDGSTNANFQAYVGYLPSQEHEVALRRKLLHVAPFVESGKYTLKIDLTDEAARDAEKLIPELLAVGDGLRSL